MSKEEKAGFKINISGGSEGLGKGLTKAIILEPGKFPLAGKKIGESFNGALIGLPGYELKITGGSDSSGIPMRFDVHGPVKKRILLSNTPGYHPKDDGIKRRKIIRGNEVTDDMVQVNCVIVKYGKEKFFGAAAEAEQKPASEKAEKAEKPEKAEKKKK
jgi:small subunit ribosomal protein S6e